MTNPSNISQATLADLRALTAEHVNRFTAEGRTAVKGAGRRSAQLDKQKDPFERPSPGLIKRLATEARNESNRRIFQEDEAGPSDEQRREILRAKARKYEALRRGDYSGMTEKEISEAVLDFNRCEDDLSDHPSDTDESALPPGSAHLGDEDDLDRVEYIDEMGRTRIGTRRQRLEAELARSKASELVMPPENEDSAYAEVLKSNVIHGDQSFFPVYQPDEEVIRAKYREAEEEARSHHYDASKEVRTKGAGQYQFSLDETERTAQMNSLAEQRSETERARGQTQGNRGQSAAQIARKRKMDERKKLIEGKRARLLGGEDEVARLRSAKKAAETEDFLAGLEEELK